MSEIFGFWGRETLSNIRRNRLMSLLAVSTVTIGLFVLGAFYLAWGCVHSTVNTQTKKLDLIVILERDVSAKRRKEIIAASRIQQVASLTLVTRDVALRNMAKEQGDFVIGDLLKDNPLGDELHITLKNPEEIFKVRGYLSSLKGVKAIRRPAEDRAVNLLLSVNKFVKIAGAVAFFVLGLGILLIIHNAIRLTIFARRREIRIMELVGATSWFIRIPFLLEGLVYGILGAVYAGVALFFIYTMVVRSSAPIVKILLPAAPMLLLWQCLSLLGVAGLLFGVAGSWLSLSRSLGRTASI